MRRATFLEAVKKIVFDLDDSDIAQEIFALIEVSRKGETVTRRPDLRAFQQYSIAVSNYNEAEHEILRVFQLEPLLDPTFWLRYLAAGPERPEPGLLYEVRRAVDNARTFLPQVATLLENERLERLRSSSGDVPPEIRGHEVLSLIIPESANQFSSPKRITFAIDAVNELYWAIATLNNLNADDITIISCDSGSDKSFDFTGLPQIIQGVRGVIVDVWDRIVLHRHHKARASIETIAGSLPVLIQITEMESSGSIAPELAEQLRRRTLQACDHFIEAGAIIPDMEQTIDITPRQLMKPERKLLAAPTGAVSTSPEPTARSEPSENQEDENEELEVKELLRQMLREKKKTGAAGKASGTRRAKTTKKSPPSM